MSRVEDEPIRYDGDFEGRVSASLAILREVDDVDTLDRRLVEERSRAYPREHVVEALQRRIEEVDR